MNIFRRLKRVVVKLTASRSAKPTEEAMIVSAGEIPTEEIREEVPCPTFQDFLTPVTNKIKSSRVYLPIPGRVLHLAKYARKLRVRKKNLRRQNR